MPEKDPANWALGTWVLALSMAVGGETINWYKDQAYTPERLFVGDWRDIHTDLSYDVFMLLSLDQPVCAFAGGVSGHITPCVRRERAIASQAHSRS